MRLVELIMRAADHFEAPPGPPSDEEIQALFEIEADVLSGRFFERVLGAAGVEEEAPVREAPTSIDADGEPCFQRGAHIEEVQAQLQQLLARRAEDAGESDGVPMSVSGSTAGGVDGARGDGVQMSGGGSAGEADIGRGDGVQMSGGEVTTGEGHEHGQDGVQMSGGAPKYDEHRQDDVRTSEGAPAHDGGGQHDGAQVSVAASAAEHDEAGQHDGVQMSVAAPATGASGAGSRDGVRMSGSAAPGREACAEGEDAVQMSVGADGGHDPVELAADRITRAQAARERRPGGRSRRRKEASIRVLVREDVALFYRELEAAFVRSGMPGSFLWFLVWTCWETHGARFSFGNKWKPIFDRDRHQCASPVCEERDNLSNHHIEYRGHGGGDEMSNQILASYFCHFEGEHGGRLKVRGTAERPVWLLGRVPIMRVVGREKAELTAP